MPDQAPVWTSIAGPWGPVHVAATARGVVAIDWQTTGEAFVTSLGRRLATSVVAADEAAEDDERRTQLDLAVAAVRAFLDGRPSTTDVAFDLADRPAWDRRVLEAVAGVPWGRTSSYGEIARRIGAPRAARAVGGAVGRNPIGLLIPCHRVIAADGSIGGYGGDAWGSREDRIALKRELLLREGVTVAPAGD